MQRRFLKVKPREVSKNLLAMMNEEKKHVNCIFDTSIEREMLSILLILEIIVFEIIVAKKVSYSQTARSF